MSMTAFHLTILVFAHFIVVSSFYYDERLYVPKYKKFLDAQSRLATDLFANYDPTISPIYMWYDTSKPIGYDPEAPPRYNYSLFLYYLKLVEVLEPEEKVSVVLEIMEYWYDARLSWNASDYENVTAMIIRQQKVWSPTLSAFGVNDIVDFRDNDFRIVCVDNLGLIYDYLSVRVSANCPMDVQMFPFDTQICQISFCLPIFNMKEVEVFNEIYTGILQDSMLKTMGNSEWKLINLTNRVEPLKYNDNFGTMDLAIFEITIRRNPLYYIYMIVFPSFVINLVSIIGVFLKGADKMSRLNVGLTNIMTMTFILGVMADKIPRTGSIPLLGIYIIINLVIMLIAIAIVTIITEIRRCAMPCLKLKNTAFSRKLETFLGPPLEYTCATILALMTTANFMVMIGFWLDDS